MLGCSSEYNDSNRAFESYLDIRFRNVIRQQLDMSCGLAALSDVLYFGYDLKVTEYEMIDRVGLKDSYSFEDLRILSTYYGIYSIPIWISYENLSLLSKPAILFVKRNGVSHFVTLLTIDKYHVQIKDPAWGVLNYTREQFESYWLDDNKLKGRVLAFINDSKEYHRFEINKKLILY